MAVCIGKINNFLFYSQILTGFLSAFLDFQSYQSGYFVP